MNVEHLLFVHLYEKRIIFGRRQQYPCGQNFRQRMSRSCGVNKQVEGNSVFPYSLSHREIASSRRVQSAFTGTIPWSFIAFRTVSVSMTFFSLTLQLRHQSAVKSIKMALFSAFKAAMLSSENGCHGTSDEKSSGVRGRQFCRHFRLGKLSCEKKESCGCR